MLRSSVLQTLAEWSQNSSWFALANFAVNHVIHVTPSALSYSVYENT